MAKKYLGFGIREIEKEKGLIFKHKMKEEIFCKIQVGADSFAEAQQILCDNMRNHSIMVGLIFPYWEEEDENEQRR